MPRAVPESRFQDLIDAATRVFIERGYRRTQIADVAEAMRVAKGTVYLYVQSKEALFDQVVRHTDGRRPIPTPATLPVPAPPRGSTLRYVRERLAAETSRLLLPKRVGRRAPADVRSELESIVRDLYDAFRRQRLGLKLLDRCAPDYPELARIWFHDGREGLLGLLTRYLESRAKHGRIVLPGGPAIVARQVIENVVFWAVHRHWDPSPQAVDDRAAEDAVVALLSRALLRR